MPEVARTEEEERKGGPLFCHGTMGDVPTNTVALSISAHDAMESTGRPDVCWDRAQESGPSGQGC